MRGHPRILATRASSRNPYFPLVEQTRTHNDLYYVGPAEKERFLGYLHDRLRDARLEGLVKNLFRPSYAGNRNCTLMYTLGGVHRPAGPARLPPYVRAAIHSCADGRSLRQRLRAGGVDGEAGVTDARAADVTADAEV